jgi:hypothetical protein
VREKKKKFYPKFRALQLSLIFSLELPKSTPNLLDKSIKESSLELNEEKGLFGIPLCKKVSLTLALEIVL